MHGIIGFGGYIPYRRLDLSTVADVAGGGGRKGTRSIASFDEDATTMAVEAARVARRRAPDVPIESVWFATVAPPYLDKTNATVLQAALRLPGECAAYDLVGSVRGEVTRRQNAFESSLSVDADALPGGYQHGASRRLTSQRRHATAPARSRASAMTAATPSGSGGARTTKRPARKR